MMDGGKGQVNVALRVLDHLGLDIPVCGMVKDDDHRTRGMYYNNEEIIFAPNSEAFLLVTRIQDEAHRFAIEYHRSLRAKGQVHSVLFVSLVQHLCRRAYGSIPTLSARRARRTTSGLRTRTDR